jgi:hypothetical protein
MKNVGFKKHKIVGEMSHLTQNCRGNKKNLAQNYRLKACFLTQYYREVNL